MIKFLKPARLIPHSTQNYTGFQNLPSFFAYAHAFSRYLGFKVEKSSKNHVNHQNLQNHLNHQNLQNHLN